MKCILAFDKFKHSLTSAEAARAAEDGIRLALYDRGLSDRGDTENPEIVVLPVADGGEGTVDAFLAAVETASASETASVGTRVVCRVTPPHKSPGDGVCIDAQYAVTEMHRNGVSQRTAVMEMSAASGLGLVPESERNPMRTSTYGTGEMIRHALDRGERRFLLGLGGSATNDGGCGMAAALGAVFTDRDGNIIPCPTGGDLCRIADIDLSTLDARLRECVFTACCDVDNPLTGVSGAAAVYAPQKGAVPDDIPVLDAGLENIAAILWRKYGISVETVPGAGAAGGMGGGVMAFLSGTLAPGIDAVLDAAGLDVHLASADLLLTGEGRLDDQTVRGKTVCGILRRTRARGVPALVFGGCVEKEALALYELGAAGIFALCDRPMTKEESMSRAGELLRERVRAAVGCFLAGR